MSHGRRRGPENTISSCRLNYLLTKLAKPILLSNDPKHLIIRWVIADEICSLRTTLVIFIVLCDSNPSIWINRSKKFSSQPSTSCKSGCSTERTDVAQFLRRGDQSLVLDSDDVAESTEYHSFLCRQQTTAVRLSRTSRSSAVVLGIGVDEQIS